MESKEKLNKNTCPLLKHSSDYTSDSVDLLTDIEARTYWLKCLEGLGHQFVEKASYLHPEDSSAPGRAEKCKDSFHKILHNLKEDPL